LISLITFAGVPMTRLFFRDLLANRGKSEGDRQIVFDMDRSAVSWRCKRRRMMRT
jgi:hypothetical protein